MRNKHMTYFFLFANVEYANTILALKGYLVSELPTETHRHVPPSNLPSGVLHERRVTVSFWQSLLDRFMTDSCANHRDSDQGFESTPIFSRVDGIKFSSSPLSQGGRTLSESRKEVLQIIGIWTWRLSGINIRNCPNVCRTAYTFLTHRPSFPSPPIPRDTGIVSSPRIPETQY